MGTDRVVECCGRIWISVFMHSYMATVSRIMDGGPGPPPILAAWQQNLLSCGSLPTDHPPG